MMFDKLFFKEHQKSILMYLNSSVGRFARRSLWIEDNRHPILKVTPNTYFTLLPDGRVKINMHTCNQHAEALHKNYRWLWQAIHAWDMRIANRLMPAWNLGFDTYTWQPDTTAGLDCYIQSAAPTGNNDDSSFPIGEDSTGTNIVRALIKFTQLSDGTIPAAYVASSCILTLTQYTEQATNARTLRWYRQKRDWVETQATWNIWKTSNNWSTAGGFHTDDCEQTDIGSLAFSATEAAGDKAWTLTASAITAIINGSWANNGFMGKADTEADDEQFFRSSNYATAGDRPELVTIAAPVLASNRSKTLLGVGQ